MKKVSKTQIVRWALQIASFFLLPMLFIDAFNGLKTVTTAIVNGTFDFTSLLPELFVTVFLLVITLVFGRLFCGWMCAFGSLGDLFHFVGKKLFRINYRIPERFDAVLKKCKYVLFFFTLIGIWILGLGLFSSWSPWDVFGMEFSLTPDWGLAFTSFTVGTILLIAILVGSLFVERFFCRYFCPMGAAFAAASTLRIASIKKPADKCGKCRVCTNECAMGIPLYKYDVVRSGECIQCMKCIPKCPRSNVILTIAGSDVKPLATAATVASVMGLYYIGSLVVSSTDVSAAASQSAQAIATPAGTQPGSYVNTPSPTPTTTMPTNTPAATATPTQAFSYKDGTYQGSGNGFRGTTTVSVTISGGKISNISTVSTRDDGKYYNRAFSTVTSEIISAQSTSVKAISGATYSSKGIMYAVANALAKAK